MGEASVRAPLRLAFARLVSNSILLLHALDSLVSMSELHRLLKAFGLSYVN